MKSPNRARAHGAWLSVAFACACSFSATANDKIAITDTITGLSGLSAPAEVAIGATQIPSIQAQSEEDMAYLLGWYHAKDRLFQMDYTRRLASGTLAELVGTPALASDIKLRALGFERAGLRSLQAASAKTQAILQAYANGVNAWVASHPLPIEYQNLELATFKPWRPVDSVSIAKIIAFQLSNDLNEIDNTVALGTFQQVGQAAGFDGTALYFEDLYRIQPPDDRVSVPGFLERIGGSMLAGNTKSLDLKSIPLLSEVEFNLAKNLQDQWNADPIINKLKQAGPDEKGSNTWAYAGDHTASGFPVIANDPHLSLDYPSVFYPFQATVNENGNSRNLAGVSFPGAPVMAQGCNDNLCWGSTVHPVDETDFFFDKVELNLLGLPTNIIHNGQREPIIWLFQSYFANQIGDGIMDNLERQNVGYDAGALTFIVPRRDFGPILQLDKANKRAVTMQYTGFSPTQEIEAFFDMARASDVNEFKQALTKFDVGSQNFVVADTSGNIAYFTGAEVPVREDLQTMNAVDGTPPMFIRDGSGEHKNEWMSVQNPQPNQATPHEIIPFEEMPWVINPESGYVVNANNDPIGVSLDNNPFNQLRPGGGLYYLFGNVYSSYRMGRADRLVQAAAAAGNVTADQVKTQQSNNQMLDAELVAPHLLNAFDNATASDAWPGIAQFAADPRVQQAIALISEWDYSTPTGVTAGYDAGDDPFNLPVPDQNEINHSVAATIWAMWRSMVVQNTIDATMKGIDAAIGQNLLAPQLPGGRVAYNDLKHLLDNWQAQKGVGASGINFFTNPQAPTPEDARDYVLLASLKQALDKLASDDFAAAFNHSTDVMDYRWGKLHRIVFSHPLGDSLSIPNGLFGFATQPGLRGIARQGGYEVLDASRHDIRADGLDEFMFAAGPARRFVGTLTDDGPVADQIIPGGQSGVITEGANYVNQLFFWLVNAYHPLFLDANLINQIASERIQYTP